MAKYKKQCGPTAIDEFDGYTKWSSGEYDRSHNVTGTGVMTSCYASSAYKHSDSYRIGTGITELADACLSKNSIDSISLPNTLKKIGSSCFSGSSITSISLPDSLEEMGHNNFPSSLAYLTLPINLKLFPTDNVFGCKKLADISVHKDNKYFKSIDGILYNHDVTEILVCPRGKSGKVIIPDSVKRIADYCFSGCSNLTAIELPRSIETIGHYAFSGLSLDRLLIPNSVISIGEGCFYNITIRQKFRLSIQVTSLRDKCFQNADIPIDNSLLLNIEEIGNNCFDNNRKYILPTNLRMPRIKKIGEHAFNGAKNIKTIELPSCVQQIGKGAFSSTTDDLKIIFLSIVPFKYSDEAFWGLGDTATLYVPIGSKIIFDNSIPWSLFSRIEEFEVNCDFTDESNTITDEQFYFRLQNIVSSFTNADRYFLQEILHDLAQYYQKVDNEEDYNEAIQIIKYNQGFNPPLIPGLEKSICNEWLNKYKLRLAYYCIMNSRLITSSLPVHEEKDLIDKQKKEDTPLLIDGQLIGNIKLPTTVAVEEIEVHFSGILRHLQNELSLATKSIKVAVSWFTNYALFKQIKEIAQNGATVQIIINNDSVNNGGYCLNFNELIEAGVHVSLVEYPHLIHHKFCIIDDKTVINGSYNWTRFSENNYENIMIFKNNNEISEAFNDEFEHILDMAEYQDVSAMPDCVPLRPEYDRNAFKQYITEELDAEARQTSDQRDKITALQKASKLNPDYLEKINPEAKRKFEEEFKVIEQSETMAKAVVEMVKEVAPTTKEEPKQQESKQSTKPTSAKSKNSTAPVSPITQKTAEESTIIQQIKASQLLMVLDVSGSMESTYKAGHVANIAKKSVSAALTLSDTQTVSLWEFGNDASFIQDIGLENLSAINNVHCKKQGTYLQKFVSKADSTIKNNSLVIVFTDDDGASIRQAISGMQKRTDVFWQIIVYGGHDEITKAIKGISNISLVSMTDYASKADEEITKALLKDYINWKK